MGGDRKRRQGHGVEPQLWDFQKRGPLSSGEEPVGVYKAEDSDDLMTIVPVSVVLGVRRTLEPAGADADDEYDPGCPASEPDEAATPEIDQLASRVDHLVALEERHSWLQEVDASRRLQLMKPLSFAEWVFDFASGCGPKRLSDEEIGDAMEDIAKKVKKGRGASWIYLKASSTLLWFLVNAAGETVKKVLGKSKTG